MPRAFHADAELEASASRDQLTERETPRLGLRTPRPPPQFCHTHCCAALWALLQPFAILPRAAAFFLIALLGMQPMVSLSRERHASRLPIFDVFRLGV